MKPKWERVPGSYTSERYMGEWRRRCAACKQIQPVDYTYASDGTAVVCAHDGCGQRFYEYTLPAPGEAPKQIGRVDVATDRIMARLVFARTVLDRALDDLKKAMRRVAAHRRRISRLEAALRIPAQARQARAQKAVATRKRRPVRRGINLRSSA